MEGKRWQFHVIGQVSGYLSGLIVQSSQEACQDLIYYDHRNLGNMKAQDKVLTSKQLQPTVWTRQRPLNMSTNRNKTWDWD